jgi:RNA exonuclease NGL2
MCRYVYERARWAVDLLSAYLFTGDGRQTAILLRSINQFRQDLGKESWPCIIAGGGPTIFLFRNYAAYCGAQDFNFTPQEGTYNLLHGSIMTEEQVEKIDKSRVVHLSVDPPVVSDAPNCINEHGDPDRVIKDARRCTTHDGLLTASQLTQLFGQLPKVRSAYALANKELGMEHSKCFGQLTSLNENDNGFFEPLITAYAHYWKTTLGKVLIGPLRKRCLNHADYIFLLDPNNTFRVVGVAELPPPDSLEPGLPLLGISASDHISLAAEIIVANSSIT